MGEARQTGSTRVPAHCLHRPERELFGWMIIIALSVGLDVAAGQDAFLTHRHFWQVVFSGVITAKIMLYGCLAWTWSRWI